MSDFTSPWQGYDFSGLSAALSRIQEITRPALEALQNIQSTLQPIVEALEQYKPKVEEIGQVLLHVSRRFSAIVFGSSIRKITYIISTTSLRGFFPRRMKNKEKKLKLKNP